MFSSSAGASLTRIVAKVGDEELARTNCDAKFKVEKQRHTMGLSY